MVMRSTSLIELLIYRSSALRLTEEEAINPVLQHLTKPSPASSITYLNAKAIWR